MLALSLERMVLGSDDPWILGRYVQRRFNVGEWVPGQELVWHLELDNHISASTKESAPRLVIACSLSKCTNSKCLRGLRAPMMSKPHKGNFVTSSVVKPFANTVFLI
eukprot:215935-Amphidinium_carterae.1